MHSYGVWGLGKAVETPTADGMTTEADVLTAMYKIEESNTPQYSESYIERDVLPKDSDSQW